MADTTEELRRKALEAYDTRRVEDHRWPSRHFQNDKHAMAQSLFAQGFIAGRSDLLEAHPSASAPDGLRVVSEALLRSIRGRVALGGKTLVADVQRLVDEALASPPAPSPEAPERKPGFDWKLSDDARAEIKAIEDAQRQAAHNARNIIVGSPALPTPTTHPSASAPDGLRERLRAFCAESGPGLAPYKDHNGFDQPWKLREDCSDLLDRSEKLEREVERLREQIDAQDAELRRWRMLPDVTSTNWVTTGGYKP